jgi:hypothetical protein
MSPNGFDRHASDVPEVQEEVTQTPRSPPPPRSSPNVMVYSPTPKLSPDTVKDAYPLCGAFSRISEIKAASKLNDPSIVPATLPTVTHELTRAPSAAIVYAGPVRQLTVVAELQLDVRHTAPESTVVCVYSFGAKSSPVTVTDAYPLSGVFRSPYDTTAPSKLKPRTFVPATLATVTTIDCSNRWLIPNPIPRPSPA